MYSERYSPPHLKAVLSANPTQGVRIRGERSLVALLRATCATDSGRLADVRCRIHAANNSRRKRDGKSLTALQQKVLTRFACLFIVGPFERGMDDELILAVSEPRFIEQRGTERRGDARSQDERPAFRVAGIAFGPGRKRVVAIGPFVAVIESGLVGGVEDVVHLEVDLLAVRIRIRAEGGGGAAVAARSAGPLMYSRIQAVAAVEAVGSRHRVKILSNLSRGVRRNAQRIPGSAGRNRIRTIRLRRSIGQRSKYAVGA